MFTYVLIALGLFVLWTLFACLTAYLLSHEAPCAFSGGIEDQEDFWCPFLLWWMFLVGFTGVALFGLLSRICRPLRPLLVWLSPWHWVDWAYRVGAKHGSYSESKAKEARE